MGAGMHRTCVLAALRVCFCTNSSPEGLYTSSVIPESRRDWKDLLTFIDYSEREREKGLGERAPPPSYLCRA